MSGGHYNYLYSRIEDEYRGELEFPILNELLIDFCKLLRSLEWYKSDDTSQEEYHKDVEKFMAKWFKPNINKLAYIKAKNDIVVKLQQFSETLLGTCNS